MILQLVVCSAGIALCLFGMRRVGYRDGFIDGAQTGGLMMIREMCAGNVRVDDGKLFIESGELGIYTKDGEKMTEITLDDLEFMEK